MERLSILDKYITKQLIETFLLGVIIFTSIMFASDTFINLAKQVSSYGISFNIALMIFVLKLPSIFVLTIPMGVLLATINTFNRLSTSSEIAVMRACGISIARLSLSALVFGICAALLSFFVNEFVVPAANIEVKTLTVWAFNQKNTPEGKSNFSFKDLDENNQLKKLYYINNCHDKKYQGVTVVDMSKKDTIRVIQSKYASPHPAYWEFNQGASYIMTNSNKILSTAAFGQLKDFSNFGMGQSNKGTKAKELNFIGLSKYIHKQKKNEDMHNLVIQLQEKFAIPITSFFLALIGVPLAITPPRVRINRGFLFSILVIFCYYLIRAFSISLGEAQILDPVFSAWLPNIVIGISGIILFYRKAWLI